MIMPLKTDVRAVFGLLVLTLILGGTGAGIAAGTVPAHQSGAAVTPVSSGTTSPTEATAPTTTTAPTTPTSVSPTSSSPDSVVLKGGKAGTVFNEMTIEGEDRIRIEFERPDLHIEVDPRSAKGLDWDHSLEVLDRNAPSEESPILARSALDRTPRRSRPWLHQFATGPVARFRPQVDRAIQWTLTVADSRGNTVASFHGDGKVPDEIPWDGAAASGGLAMPGLVYSYAFEAFDRAGNKRSILGDGFQIRPYARTDAGTLTLLFTGLDLGGDSQGAISPILLDAAGWLNQIENLASPIRVEVRAQGIDQAKALADRVAAGVKSSLLGDPARLQTFTVLEPDAPSSGTIVITAKR